MFNTDSFKIHGKYFSDNIESEGYVKIFSGADLLITEFEEAGTYYAQVKNSEFPGSPEYILINNFNKDRITVIFVMDSHTFRKPRNYEKFASLMQNRNVIIVHQPCTENINAYSEICHDMNMFLTSKILTVKMIDLIINKIRESGSKKILLAGSGDGGWIVNLHTALCAASVTYMPFYTGSGTGDLFFNSSIKNYISAEARKRESSLINLLNFDDIYMSNSKLCRIFPVLSENDEYNNLMRQKTSYQDSEIKITKKAYSSAIRDQKFFAEYISSIAEKR
ncbi:MAG: hypothetical protein JW982_14825 [Spirochaetes bacterium]|nr:hypothetical protein [Spirochaetota bacterium]